MFWRISNRIVSQPFYKTFSIHQVLKERLQASPIDWEFPPPNRGQIKPIVLYLFSEPCWEVYWCFQIHSVPEIQEHAWGQPLSFTCQATNGITLFIPSHEQYCKWKVTKPLYTQQYPPIHVYSIVVYWYSLQFSIAWLSNLLI